jgi:6-phospho-beta-glucosidase
MAVIAVVGGSGAATPELAASLHDAGIEDIELRLIGRSPNRLATVRAASQSLAGSGIRVTADTDRARGLSGANVIVNQVRVGGLRARAFDESFPLEFGIPGEETLGPGGFANALRTVPVALDIARTIEREVPDATVLNLTNPAGMVHQAMVMATRSRVISLCDSPISLVAHASRLAGVGPGDDPDYAYVGMNHCGWLTALCLHGGDRLPSAIEAYARAGERPVDGDVVRSLGVLPVPYLRYYYHADRMLAAQEGKRSRAEELLDLEALLLAAYRAPGDVRPPELERRGAVWYSAAVVPVIRALFFGEAKDAIVGTVNAGLFPWLPPEVVVESQARIGPGGVSERRAGDLPADARSLLATHAAFESLTVAGILEQDEGKLLRALIANPMIPSTRVARDVLAGARGFEVA